MKKSLPLLSFLIIFLQAAVNVYAQLPNNSFETWNSTSYDELDNWHTANQDVISQMDIATVSKVTGHSGYAVRMETTVIGPDTGEAFIANGDPHGEGGIPCSQQATAIAGYYRYNLPVNDSAIIIVIFKHNGSIISSDVFKIKGTGVQNTFAPFSFPLSLSSTPDSVIIAAASSNLLDGTGIEDGSFLELDELALTGTSVTIDNSNFENWTPTSLDLLTGWESNGEGVTKTTDSHSGSYAVMLTTIDYGGGNIGSSGITTGHNGQNGPPTGGLPYSSMADTLTGYYKYITSGSDSATISVSLSNNSNMVGGNGVFLPAASVYTYFEIPVSCMSMPDTMRIDISSSMWPFTPSSAGSSLYIDDLSLKSHLLLGISSMKKSSGPAASVYPNPAVNVLNIKLAQKTGTAAVMSIHDACGRVVKQQNINSLENHFEVNVSDLSSGIYFYDIIDGTDFIPGRFTKQ